MAQIISTENGLSFELNSNDLTAKIAHSPNACGNILIARSINFQDKEYVITHIQPNSFSNNKKIQSIVFSEDSALFSIGSNSFDRSTIQSINVPSTVEELQEGWCSKTFDLTTVTISPGNQQFKYLDDKHQIIITKSDKTKENFDVIVFASRDINKVIIPSYIKRINSFAFDECVKLQIVQMSENSQLQSIGKNSFSNSLITSLFIPSNVEELQEGWCTDMSNLSKVNISPNNKHFKFLDERHHVILGKSDKTKENFDVIVFASRDINKVSIPSYVKHICSSSFDSCENLISVEIQEDSQLQSIGEYAFSGTFIKSIFIPPNLEKLQEGWFSDSTKLSKIILSPNNKNFKYMNEKQQIVLCKSDKNSENFDVLVFASKDLIEERIPSYIKYIHPHAFHGCNKLKKILFPKNSELTQIGNDSFSGTSIEKITIPKTVEKIGRCAFSFCSKLKHVVFEKGSKLKFIPNCLFNYCSKLCSVEIPEDSELKKIGRGSFLHCCISKIYLPSKLEEIQEGWCMENNSKSNLDITISPKNRYIKFLDINHQIIRGRSDKNKEKLDSIVFVKKDIKDVKVPFHIKYIKMHSFSECKKLKKIEFPENSELCCIETDAFNDCSVECINIPASVENLQEGWCAKTAKLNQVIISPNNKNYKYLDEKHEIILGKSDKSKEDFDVIVFASRNIKEVIIPSYIKRINSYAFQNCSNLKTIKFQENSQLRSIGSESFASSNLEKITIPKNVEVIENRAFSFCLQLKEVVFEKESKLTTLSEGAFTWCKDLKIFDIQIDSKIESFDERCIIFSQIEKLYIPSKCEFFGKGWCFHINTLNEVTISPNNPNLKYLDDSHKIILGKSDESIDLFDSIVFACRDIIEITIPSFIKTIKSFAFENCKKLRNVEFLPDSNLEVIETAAFSDTSLERITIPKKVYKMQDDGFDISANLKQYEFLGDFLLTKFHCLDLCGNLIIVSFPNLHEITVDCDNYSSSSNYVFLISANAIIHN